MRSPAEPATDPLLPRTVRVLDRRQETHDTWTLTLDAPSDEFRPGQFSMLYAFGTGEVPISVSGEPGGPLVHTIRSVGAVTTALCAARDEVGVRGPFGTTWPLDAARGRDVVVMAGGIGLAPLRPVVYELIASRGDFGRVALLYGGRSPGELLYGDELDDWRRHGIQVEVTVDAADERWRGNVGVVTTLMRRIDFDPGATTAMLCGPEAMMRFGSAALEQRGVPPAGQWVSLERSMKCAVGFCGHCQLGPFFICKDGAVFRHDEVAPWLRIREL